MYIYDNWFCHYLEESIFVIWNIWQFCSFLTPFLPLHVSSHTHCIRSCDKLTNEQTRYKHQVNFPFIGSVTCILRGFLRLNAFTLVSFPIELQPHYIIAISIAIYSQDALCWCYSALFLTMDVPNNLFTGQNDLCCLARHN